MLDVILNSITDTFAWSTWNLVILRVSNQCNLDFLLLRLRSIPTSNNHVYIYIEASRGFFWSDSLTSTYSEKYNVTMRVLPILDFSLLFWSITARFCRYTVYTMDHKFWTGHCINAGGSNHAMSSSSKAQQTSCARILSKQLFYIPNWTKMFLSTRKRFSALNVPIHIRKKFNFSNH